MRCLLRGALLLLAAAVALAVGAHWAQSRNSALGSGGDGLSPKSVAAWLGRPVQLQLSGWFGPTATATHTPTSPPTATPTATATPAPPPDGVIIPPAPYLRWRRPFDAPYEDRPSRSYPYGSTGGGAYLMHHGVDISNPLGTTVVAVADGQVIYAGPDDQVRWGPQTDFYGLLVVLEHRLAASEPLYSLYGHLSKTLVTAGESIRAGTAVGEVGSSGVALGPHLHFEVRTSAREYDSTRHPELYLSPYPECGVVVARVVDSNGELVPEVAVSLFQLDESGQATWLASAWTYPREHIGSSAYWRENVVFGDVPAGAYRLTVQGMSGYEDLEVQAGAVSRVTVVRPD